VSRTTRYLAIGDEVDLVLAWFRGQPGMTLEAGRPDGKWFHFGDIAPLGAGPRRSPLVYVVVPRQVAGALWTVGEIGFTATPLRAQFPELHATSRRLVKWLRQYERVFDASAPESSEWLYYLEGGVQNVVADIYALPAAALALQSGQYFVPDDISEVRLDDVCKTLRLRGVECSEGGRTMRSS
jgi:hypothetical protein